MRLLKPFLLLQAIGLSAFGLLLFFKPELSLDFLGTPSMSADGIYEIRSMYGGTSLGAACLMFAGFFKDNMQRPALYFSLAYTGGYAFVRIAALPLGGYPGPFFMPFAALEILTALIALYFLRALGQEQAPKP